MSSCLNELFERISSVNAPVKMPDITDIIRSTPTIGVDKILFINNVFAIKSCINICANEDVTPTDIAVIFSLNTFNINTIIINEINVDGNPNIILKIKLPENTGTSTDFIIINKNADLTVDRYSINIIGIFASPNRTAGIGVGIKFSNIPRTTVNAPKTPINTGTLIDFLTFNRKHPR